MNELIRNFKGRHEEFDELAAVCEICGYTGKFEDFLWCNACNVIHCTMEKSCVERHINCNQGI